MSEPENFLDDQSGSWNVQNFMIRDVFALSLLWFILTLHITRLQLKCILL